jgi:hypothetical protein
LIQVKEVQQVKERKPMALTHKSINIREEVWRQLRINAELTGVPVRDFLTYLIVNSQPVPEDDRTAREQLGTVARANEDARLKPTSPFASPTPDLQPVAP